MDLLGLLVMKIDRDFIPLTMIAALVAIWLSTRPCNDPTAIAN
jgi:hypothetical protein